MRESCVLGRGLREGMGEEEGDAVGAKRARMRENWVVVGGGGRMACEVVAVRVQGMSTLQWGSGKKGSRAVEGRGVGEDGMRP